MYKKKKITQIKTIIILWKNSVYKIIKLLKFQLIGFV